MLKPTLGLLAIGLAVALLGAAATPAQGPGPDLKRLAADLDKLRDQLKDVEAKLANAKEMAARKGPFEGKGFGKGDFFKKKVEFGKPGFLPFGEKKGFVKMDPDMIKSKYEFYKKLYEDSKKETAKPAGPPFAKGKAGFGPKGFDGKKKEAGTPTPPSVGKGPGDPSRGSVEARIDRLIRELEELRNDVKKK